jgi:hypothetical protein
VTVAVVDGTLPVVLEGAFVIADSVGFASSSPTGWCERAGR